jgi:uncharacterized membrane protein YeaQ/YmgE (transglycosylase-associated protein family)
MHCNKMRRKPTAGAGVERPGWRLRRRLWYGCAPRPTLDQGNDMEPTTGTILGVTATVLVVFLIGCAIGGLIIGALARLVLPGPDPMSWLATLGYGIGGSLIGGLVSAVLHVPQALGWVISVACAAGLIWYFRRRRTTASGGATPRPPSSPPPPAT